MGLMQFLAVGRSVDRVQDHPTRYRMTQQNLLPKFGLTKPDTGSAEASSVSAAAGCGTDGGQQAKRWKTKRPAPKRAKAPALIGVVKEVFRSLKFKKSMQIASVKTESAPRVEEVGPRHAFPLGRWTMLSKASLFRNPFVRAGKPVIGQQALQTELVLDEVTPVRNDLTDADLEIISADDRKEGVASRTTSAEVGEPGQFAAVGAKPATAPAPWEAGKTQSFGPEKP